MVSVVIVPVDGTVWYDISSPEVNRVRNNPVAANAIAAPVEIFRIAMVYAPHGLKCEVSSINKRYCP
jgi:hypothetical protein